MPRGYPPTAFISSTCYDLSQVRADMKKFLDTLGLDSLLSEAPNFPASPNVSPVDNCVAAVRERADIFILIVGARYGSVLEEGRSVTNSEYLEAKAKGIPTYVFVQKRVLSILPIWERNPDADYSNVVDTSKLFEFIKKLRLAEDHWVYEFDEARNICEILQVQLAHLFMEGLLLRKQMKDIKHPLIEGISSRALRIMFERGEAWEYRLFNSALQDEIELAKGEKWDLKYELKMLHMRSIERLQLGKFLSEKLNGIKALLDNSNNIVNIALKEAFGPSGVPGNPEHIIYCARRLAEIYKKCLIWTMEFSCLDADQRFSNILVCMAKMSEGLIDALESLPLKFDREIDEALRAKKNGEERVNNLTIELNLPHVDSFTEECEKLTQWMHSDPIYWAGES